MEQTKVESDERNEGPSPNVTSDPVTKRRLLSVHLDGRVRIPLEQEINLLLRLFQPDHRLLQGGYVPKVNSTKELESLQFDDNL